MNQKMPNQVRKPYNEGQDWVHRRNISPPVSGEKYDFTNHYPDIRSLIMTIGLMGEDLVGVELGLYRAESFCTLLQCCPNIKTLYGIDYWDSYLDKIGGTKEVNLRSAELNRMFALHYVRWSGAFDRAKILEKETLDALEDFEDNSLDFVFFDAHLTPEQLIREMIAYYPKIKEGGLVSGHDWHVREVRDAVREVKETLGLANRTMAYDKTFAWFK